MKTALYEIEDIIEAFDPVNESDIVIVGDKTVGSISELLVVAPHILDRQNAPALARAINHFASGGDFEVIQDPEIYEAEYRAQLAIEDPTAPYVERVVRLCDFGIPDFAAITAPRFAGQTFVFHAKDRTTGLPYRVEIDQVTKPVKPIEPRYQALELSPVLIEKTA